MGETGKKADTVRRTDFLDIARGFKRLARDIYLILKWGVISLVCLAVLVTVAAVVYDLVETLKLRPQRKAAEKRQILLSMERVANRHWAIPEKTNRGNYYGAAVSIIEVKGSTPDDKALVPILSRALTAQNSSDPRVAEAAKEYTRITDDPRLPVPDYMMADAKAFLADKEIALRLVREALDIAPAEGSYLQLTPRPVKFPTAYYRVDWNGYDTLLPHLTRLRAISRMLAVSAWVAAEEGRTADAMRDVRAGYAMGDSLGREPGVISLLVSMACQSIAQSAFTRVAARNEIGSSDLEALQRDLEGQAENLTTHFAYEGELATVCDLVDEIGRGEKDIGYLLELVENTHGEMEAQAGYSKMVKKVCAAMPALYTRGYMKANEEFAIRYMLALINQADNSTPEEMAQSLGKEHPLDRELQGSWLVLARGVLPALGRVTVQTESNRVRLSAAAAGCAAMRYKNDKGEWPETLEALVPDYMAKVPVDPFTAKPLIYAKKDGGVVIYSVGENRKDDGGIGPGLGPKQPQDDVVRDDWGFMVWAKAGS